uniref:Secreted protein n=1 Tax=Cucumis melo TaxID=3656 RepID=A0A9I9EGE5_CUCME
MTCHMGTQFCFRVYFLHCAAAIISTRRSLQPVTLAIVQLRRAVALISRLSEVTKQSLAADHSVFNRNSSIVCFKSSRRALRSRPFVAAISRKSKLELRHLFCKPNLTRTFTRGCISCSRGIRAARLRQPPYRSHFQSLSRATPVFLAVNWVIESKIFPKPRINLEFSSTLEAEVRAKASWRMTRSDRGEP